MIRNLFFLLFVSLCISRTFYPFWAVIKTLAEKLAVLHMNLVKTWTDLMKDIVRYAEEQQKKHKAVSYASTACYITYMDTNKF